MNTSMSRNEGEPHPAINIHVSPCEESNLATSPSADTNHSINHSINHSDFLTQPEPQPVGSPPQSGTDHSTDNSLSTSHDKSEVSTGISITPNSELSIAQEQSKLKPRWWQRPIIMIPLVLLSIVLILFAVLMGVLYPRDPTVTASNLHIASLSISYTSNPILVNATVLMDIAVYNPNYYGSHYEDSQISYNSDNHQGLQGIIEIPGDYIGSRSHITHTLSTNLTNVVIDLPSIYQWQDSGLTVNAAGETRGWVDVLDIRVDYALKTKCRAKFTLDLASFTANVLEQDCSSAR